MKSDLGKNKQEQHFKTLMRYTLQGNQKIYHQLLTEISPLAQRYVRKKISNADQVDDVLQEILIAIHKSLPSFRMENDFFPWFYAICHYKVMDYLRRLYAQGETASLEDVESLSAENSAKDVTFSIETNEHLHKVLQKVPPKSRLLLVLHKGLGLSIKEVATRVNMNESAVKVNIHRALKKIREV